MVLGVRCRRTSHQVRERERERERGYEGGGGGVAGGRGMRKEKKVQVSSVCVSLFARLSFCLCLSV